VASPPPGSSPAAGTRAGIERHAARAEHDVRRQVRYWRTTTADRRSGGFLVRDFAATRWPRLHRWRARRHADKQVVAQTRLVWTFAHTHLAGWGTAADLVAARRGVDFLLAHFWDADEGGWIWKTTRDGTWLDDRKNLVAQVGALYAFVEHTRATGDADTRRFADETFGVIEARFRDRERGGWIEDLARDWGPADPNGLALVDRIGTKSANVTLHVMEAYAEYVALTRDPVAEQALADALDVMRTWFFPGDDPSRHVSFRREDWSMPDDPDARKRSYGHEVEFAWLALRAEQVLGRVPDWDRFFGMVDDVMQRGFDHDRGGLRCGGEIPEKIWWPQAEFVAALVEADTHRPDAGYDRALLQTLDFVDAHLVDPADRVWYEIVADDGAVVRRRKAHDWKSTYHDVRALVKLAHAYGSGGSGSSG
jgi:mannobiose 2-epimerase